MLFRDPVLSPLGGSRVGVIAMAKKTLHEGDKIEELGGFEVYGMAENIEVIRRERLLPIGLALGCQVAGRVEKDKALTFDDVVIPPLRLIDRLYAEQEAMFALEPLSGTAATFVE